MLNKTYFTGGMHINYRPHTLFETEKLINLHKSLAKKERIPVFQFDLFHYIFFFKPVLCSAIFCANIPIRHLVGWPIPRSANQLLSSFQCVPMHFCLVQPWPLAPAQISSEFLISSFYHQSDLTAAG